MLQEIPRLRLLMEECAEAAQREDNRDILALTVDVLTMLTLWEEYLDFREETISQNTGKS